MGQCVAWCCDTAAPREVANGKPLDDDAWAVIERAERELARRYECKVCFDAPIATALLPCGHALCCVRCTPRHGQSCPVCAAEVEAVTRLHVL